MEFATTHDLTWLTQHPSLDQLILSIRRGIQNLQIISNQNIRQDIPREEKTNTTQHESQIIPREKQIEIA